MYGRCADCSHATPVGADCKVWRKVIWHVRIKSRLRPKRLKKEKSKKKNQENDGSRNRTRGCHAAVCLKSYPPHQISGTIKPGNKRKTTKNKTGRTEKAGKNSVCMLALLPSPKLHRTTIIGTVLTPFEICCFKSCLICFAFCDGKPPCTNAQFSAYVTQS